MRILESLTDNRKIRAADCRRYGKGRNRSRVRLSWPVSRSQRDFRAPEACLEFSTYKPCLITCNRIDLMLMVTLMLCLLNTTNSIPQSTSVILCCRIILFCLPLARFPKGLIRSIATDTIIIFTKIRTSHISKKFFIMRDNNELEITLCTSMAN